MIESLTIVVPVFNEERSLHLLYTEIIGVIDRLECSTSILFIDDGSSDASHSLLLELRANDPRVNILKLSRNFGKESALTAGIDHAVGDAILIIDADLQDPIGLLPEMLVQLSKGFDVVLARRRSRTADSLLRRSLSWIHYRLLRGVSDVEIPPDVGDFRLMSRKVVDAVKALPEKQRYMKGVFAWVGFSQVCIEFDRPDRAAGQSSWGLIGLTSHALDGITSFSRTPLRLATYVGFAVALVAFVYAVWIAFKTLVFGESVAGFPTLIIVILFLGGVQLISVGILGEYVGRIYLESKNRPNYIIESMGGRMFDKPSDLS